MTCKTRKINRLFGYKYDPLTLKKIKDIPDYMIQRVTCSADKILRLINPQIKYIIEQVKSKITTSPLNKIPKTVATTSVHDSDDNFSDTSDVMDYFKKEERANDLIEKNSKKSEIIAKADNDDNVEGMDSSNNSSSSNSDNSDS
ncbi:5605_t:CDS:2 [Funneliformis geosporum]|nr:5605_t:CDS:2 [Funneliformis geosporum]